MNQFGRGRRGLRQFTLLHGHRRLRRPVQHDRSSAGRHLGSVHVRLVCAARVSVARTGRGGHRATGRRRAPASRWKRSPGGGRGVTRPALVRGAHHAACWRNRTQKYPGAVVRGGGGWHRADYRPVDRSRCRIPRGQVAPASAPVAPLAPAGTERKLRIVAGVDAQGRVGTLPGKDVGGRPRHRIGRGAVARRPALGLRAAAGSGRHSAFRAPPVDSTSERDL